MQKKPTPPLPILFNGLPFQADDRIAVNTAGQAVKLEDPLVLGKYC